MPNLSCEPFRRPTRLRPTPAGEVPDRDRSLHRPDALVSIAGTDAEGRPTLGPSEFTATGTLASWDRMRALPDLDLPTLFTVGEFDEIFPGTVEEYASLVPGSRFAVLRGAAHLTFLDAPEENVAVIRAFLAEAER